MENREHQPRNATEASRGNDYPFGNHAPPNHVTSDELDDDDSDFEESEEADESEEERRLRYFEDDYSSLEDDSEALSDADWEECEYDLESARGPQLGLVFSIIKDATNGLGSASPQFIKKLIGLVEDARAALKHSSWCVLWRNIQELDKFLTRWHSSNQLQTLGPLLAILSRLFDDIEQEAIQEPKINTKEYRHGSLHRDEAKALNIIQQKWPKLWKQEMNVDFKAIVDEHSSLKPEMITDKYGTTTRLVLESIESVLLKSSVRISMGSLGLSQVPAGLLNIRSIIKWYLSFNPKPPNREVSDPVPDGEVFSLTRLIKILDLSNNCLTSIPIILPFLFPELVMLDVSKNSLTALPRTCTRWVKLRKLRIDPMSLPQKPSLDQTSKANTNLSVGLPVPTLLESCLKRLMFERRRMPALQAEFDSQIPPHLTKAVTQGRTCESCRRFLWPEAQAIYQSVCFSSENLDYPYNKRVNVGPSFFCQACLVDHIQHKTKDRECLCAMCIFDRGYHSRRRTLWGFVDTTFCLP